MLSVFPDFLYLNFFAPLVIRVVLGLVFILFAYEKLFSRRMEKVEFFEKIGLKPGRTFVVIFGIVEAIAGAFLIVGFLTQIAALAAGLISLGALCAKLKDKSCLNEHWTYYLLLLAVAVSLLFTGAGAWAFDLPL